MGFTTAGNASLPPYAQVAWFSSASRYFRQEITRRIIELLSGQTHSENISMSQPDNSISVAKIQQNFETTKDLAKKNCLLSYHSAPIAGASARQFVARNDGIQPGITAAKIRRKIDIASTFT